MTSFSLLDHLECPRCSAVHDADRVAHLCSCGSPLLARYDLERAATTMTPAALLRRPAALWRYHEVLPVRDERSVVTLGEGMTPLLPVRRLGHELGLRNLLMKDEGLVPTGSFKARGAAVGVSRAVELGVRELAMPTNGNAGAAWALYAARAGIRSRIVMPVDAPAITRAECVAAGAELSLVRGHIGDAGRIVAAIVGEGCYDASTLKEPYRIEGKKTMGYEIVEQLGWTMPDVVVYPTGGGVGLIGVHKALLELREMGLIEGPLPRLVVVQASGCAPIVRAFDAGEAESTPWEEPHTAAFGINVPKALGDFLVLDALRTTSGTAVAVDDEELLSDQRLCGRLEGLFVCPEGAACISALRRLRASGWLGEDEQIVVLNTGTGLKYPETIVLGEIPTLDPGDLLA
ncbi:MAG: threonine synthase [Acidimicrobiales bacterium]